MEEDSAGQIWFTERPGRVSRLDPVTGVRRVLLNLPDVYSTGETGLLDLALHPAFPKVPQIFTVTYQSGGHSGTTGPIDRGGGPRHVAACRHAVGWGAGREHPCGVALVVLARHHPSHVLRRLPESAHRPGPKGRGRQDPAHDHRRRPPADNPVPGFLALTTGHRNVQAWPWPRGEGSSIPSTAPTTTTSSGSCAKAQLRLAHGARLLRRRGGRQILSRFQCGGAVVRLHAHLGGGGIEWYGADAFPSLKGRVLMVSLAGQLRALRVHADKDSLLSDSILVNNRWGRLRDVLVLANGYIVVAVSNRDGRGTAGAVDDRLILLSPAGSSKVSRRVQATAAGRVLNVRNLGGRLVRAGSDLSGLPASLYLLEFESGTMVPAIQHGGLRKY
ncbi:MAG: PQQ-dependent sugar dehydrogenase [Fibrobacteres bacterium]|nr:PQQ-dependent sugar dehydrogenase [Fibrobacterota bacterium]